MVRSSDIAVWLKNVDKDDLRYIGDLSANLGEMMQAGFPVPPGFAVTTNAYTLFIRENSLDKPILHLLNTVNYRDPNSIKQVSNHIKKLITQATFPKEVSSEIIKFYENINRKSSMPTVSVRPSIFSGDLKNLFIEQRDINTNIHGEATLMHEIRKIWASLFDANVINYRHQNNMNHLTTKIALAIQQTLNPESSGVIFTINPINNDKNTILVEAIYGQGEGVTQGKVTPDHYKISKKDMKVVEKIISDQEVMIVKNKNGTKKVSVPKKLRGKQKITDQNILLLAEYAKKLEKHYYLPQDTEWAKEDGKFYILQTRQITTLSSDNGLKGVSTPPESTFPKYAVKPLLLGDPASPGIGIGRVRIIKNLRDLGKVKKGDVLVAESTGVNFIPAMKKASAIITEKSGRVSHAAAASRALGIPAVVGAPNALKILKNDMVLTVNGKTGEVMKGSIRISSNSASMSQTSLKTKTSIFVNITESDQAESSASLPVDGVGLLRSEHMITDFGIHPKKLLHDRKHTELTNRLADEIGKVCRAFYPRPVFYRLTNLKTNEYRDLAGGKMYEPTEPNPALGYRGAYRHINDPRALKLELDAIKKVREKMGLNNLNLTLPFVRTVKELEQIKRYINQSGLRRSSTFKLSLVCEVPSNVILIDEFLKVGIDEVSIGLSNLTMLMLGLDIDNEEVAAVFDEKNSAVLWAIEHMITSCRKQQVPVSIFGDTSLTSPSLIEKLVEWKITSLSVSPNLAEIIRENIYNAEKK